MTADVYDSILGLIQQGTGNNNNNWGSTFNTSFAALAARAIAGVNTITSTGGTVDYSGSPPPAGPRQDIDAIQIANGALTSDLTVIVPNLSKLWWFQNNTSGAFNMFVKTTSGNPTQIPQGCGRWVMGDGANNLTRQDKDEIGSFRLSGKAAVGAGEIACNGASLVRTEFPDLFTAIGTTWGSADSTHFTLPNFTDTGRFLRSASGSLSVGTYQSNQNLAHTHTLSGALTAGTLGTDSQGSHTHGATSTDSGHAHVEALITGGGGASYPAGGAASSTQVTGPSTASASANITTTIASAGAHTHNITGVPGIGTLAAASAGGSEARPEAAVVLMCIRY